MSGQFRSDDGARPSSRRGGGAVRTVAVVGAALVSAGLAAGLSGSDVHTAAAAPIADSAIPFFGFCPHGGGANCVVDGNTFYYGPDKVRIASIDAPEAHPPACAAEARAGKAATNRLRDLLNSGEVSLGRIDRDEDPYGRKLRHVTVGGTDVAAALVGEGLAQDHAGGRRSGWCV